MRFAARLDEALVPEWRDQYLNYKAGKKKLKKISHSQPGSAKVVATAAQSPGDFPVERIGEHNAPKSPHGVTASQLLQKPVAITGAIKFSRTPREHLHGSDVEHFSSSLPYQSMGSPLSRAIELPPPAISRHDVTTPMVPPETAQASSSAVSRKPRDSPRALPSASITSAKKPTQQKPINDRSPLLENREDTNEDYTTYEPEAANPPPNSTSFLNKNERQPTSSSLRRRVSMVTDSGESVQLDFIMESAQHDFLEWVDGEMQKIEKFYCLKEKEAIEKFLIMQDQLIQFQNHRTEYKTTVAEEERLNRAAATTKELLMKQIELPSLPEMLKRGRKDDEERNPSNGPNDYTRRPLPRIPVAIARNQLRLALKEYYRSLELLKDYKALNATAIRKIVKKFDKTVHAKVSPIYEKKVKSYQFGKSDVLENLISRTEDLFALHFEGGSHKIAVEKLRANVFPELHYAAMFKTGLFLGFAVPLFVDGFAAGIRHVNDPRYPHTTFLFQIWGGFFLVNLILCLFTINLFTWTEFKINYPFIFEFDQRHYLDYRQYGELPAFALFLMSLLGWFSFRDFWSVSFSGIYFPPIYLGISLALLFFPAKVFHWRARHWLIVALWRLLLSGLYPVEFRDFFLGDIFCSLNYSLSNVSFFFCLYAKHWDNSRGAQNCSSSHSRALGFLNCLPGIWRLLQCFRRYGDTGDWFPHLANGAKYSCLILFNMFLSLARINHESSMYHGLFVTFGVLNSLYSTVWDIFMDFSMGEHGSKHPLLRNELAFGKAWPYYTVMVLDPLMRFAWILYPIYWSQIAQSAKISFIVSLIEIVRRFLWVFVRVENEHCANVGRFRASRDLALPYNAARQLNKMNTESEEDRDELEEEAPGATASAVSSSMDSPMRSRFARRATTFAAAATPVMEAVSQALKVAHTADFERRKHVRHSAIDDEDEDEDDDDSIHGSSASTPRVQSMVNIHQNDD